MIQTTTLETSRRLYELSGWGKYDEWEPYWFFTNLPITEGTFPYVHFEPGQFHPTYTPAYDLAYLLDKLPAILTLPNGAHQLHLVKDWFVSYKGYDIVKRKETEAYKCVAGTPTEAAGLLAIKLFEIGVLPRGEA